MTAIEVFGRQLLALDNVALLLSSLLMNLAVLGVVVGVQYYRQTKDRDHTFMMVTLNLVVFLVSYFMNSVEVGLGFGFGLFALFGVVRYRTESVPVREMSYLFAVIAVGLINAVGVDVLSWVEVIVADATIATALGALSMLFWRHPQSQQRVVYDQVHNLRPERRADLELDLWERTGIFPKDIEVVSINLLNDSAVLRLTYEQQHPPHVPMVDVRSGSSNPLPIPSHQTASAAAPAQPFSQPSTPPNPSPFGRPGSHLGSPSSQPSMPFTANAGGGIVWNDDLLPPPGPDDLR